MDVLVSEVGPRDGLQSIGRTMPTPAKQRWIRTLAAAGLREIEVGSFVHPKLLPQMADAADVVRDALSIDGLTVLALAPNMKGVMRAVEAGTPKITMPVSASHAHSLANIRMSCDEAIAEVAKVCAWRDTLPVAKRPQIEIGISTAFGCTIQGVVDEGWVFIMAERLARAGADSIGLSDGVGYANPAQVKRMFTRLRAELGDRAGGAHLHNTRGQGLANVVAALEAGVRTFDSSQGGIGGCPYSPGATGNIVTEDLVWMLEAMGLDTGIDLDRLAQARHVLAEGLPGEPLYGHLPDVGVEKGFHYAARGAAAEGTGRAHRGAVCQPAGTEGALAK
ncbi:hydroxymethylglutaryl-CoA lyase [Teichococcus oryzae]|uniref:Hydroxymethylglutaryl-CoA lyase n=1 Tax=Teichococcus oryzae TaxID=1608942 RepID=A0A5B2TE68_9PROT|nr:hydroxymethylglutaryl-CoA lyase [Pseudoroseomonas oryzae]KAA2212168.1 hydroxymethylglutaryl-CoA lyase [Pseudoroseomonas oryzae]